MAQEQALIPVIGVSRENYEILARIADDFNMSIKEVADQMIQQGLKFSSFRVYRTNGKGQKDLFSTTESVKHQGATV